MKIIRTDLVNPDELDPWTRSQVYNGLDAAVTYEVFEQIEPQLDNQTASTYAFSRSLQGPLLEMRLRGIRVDKARRSEVLEEYTRNLDHLERNLERIVGDGCGVYDFNWGSNPDLQHLFYEVLGLPPVRKRGRPTVDRDALEKLEAYNVARPIISHIKAMRETRKRIGVLRTAIDSDGRIRTSYNIAGTNTGRLSSSSSEFGTGSNLQNVEELLRSVLIADPGMKMGYFDAEQIQSRIVGAIEWNLFKDGRYLDACESGDLHTSVAKLCWPRLAWVGDLATDQELAEQPYYRHYSRRFMCKKIGHGTNFRGKPYTISQQAHVDIEVIEEFQPVYFKAFPAHQEWHQWVEDEIRRTGIIHSITGRRRQFWGRRNADETVREAIAYDPQASESYIVNNGMLQVWHARDCELLMQVHDAIIVQYPEEKEDEVIPKILAQLRYPVPLYHNRELVIPYGCKTGWNFGVYHEQTNPDGLKKYKPGDKRKRSEEVHILDRKLSGIHR